MTDQTPDQAAEALAIRLYPFTGVYGTKSHKDCINTQEAARAVLDVISKGVVAGRPALVVTDELVDRAFTAYTGTVVHGNEFTRWRAALTAALTAEPLRVHHTPGEDIAPVFPATDPEREAMERVCEAADAWDKFDNVHDQIEAGDVMANLQAAVAALRKLREGKPTPVIAEGSA